jgi:hypothetical protein
MIGCQAWVHPLGTDEEDPFSRQAGEDFLDGFGHDLGADASRIAQGHGDLRRKRTGLLESRHGSGF